MADVKPRRILARDLEVVAAELKKDLEARKSSTWRKRLEQVWTEVDRQIAMEEMQRQSREPGKQDSDDWHSVLELGELSMSSELFSADIRRITFPMNRTWFEPHARIGPEQLESLGIPGRDVKTGAETPVPPKLQTMTDGAFRAMMAQQHLDFGLKARVDLSVKEALHHGSYVVTVEYEHMEQFYPDAGVKRITAPVWKAHSMWNCYPDGSPSVVGENMQYQGSMFIISYLPWKDFKQLSGDGYWADQLKKVKKLGNKTKEGDDTEDVEIENYYGDIYITRSDGDIFLPNMLCRMYNGVLAYAKENDTPFQPIIYRGWERIDVRDPFYRSSIMKMSPWQKIASVMANRFVDGIEMDLEPPVRYDKNDPEMAAAGGPELTPGAKIGTSGPNSVQEIKIGNPESALAGLQYAVQHMKENLSVSPMKAAQALGDRATAREVASVEAGAEIRPVHFIDQLNEALRAFLYMQHSLNLRNPKFEYEFYNPEMGQTDFMRVTAADLPKSAHFDVVGARGVLGEAERSQKMMLVTAFLAGSPLFAGQLQEQEIAKQMYEDAGIKNAERFLKPSDGIPPQLKIMLAQMQQQMQGLAQALQESEAGNHVKLQKMVADFITKNRKITTEQQTRMAEIAADHHSQAVDHFIRGAIEHDKMQIQRQSDGSFVATNGKKRVTVKKTSDGNWEGESQPLQ